MTSAPGFQKHPDYSVQLEPEAEPVEVRANGMTIARTDRAIRVVESRHHPVWYLPMADVDPAVLERSATETYCPFKGTASYWHVNTSAGAVEDALWGYETPYDECEALADLVSFYPNRVDVLIGEDADRAQKPGWTG